MQGLLIFIEILFAVGIVAFFVLYFTLSRRLKRGGKRQDFAGKSK